MCVLCVWRGLCFVSVLFSLVVGTDCVFLSLLLNVLCLLRCACCVSVRCVSGGCVVLNICWEKFTCILLCLSSACSSVGLCTVCALCIDCSQLC